MAAFWRGGGHPSRAALATRYAVSVQ
jgi:hypothetical protein